MKKFEDPIESAIKDFRQNPPTWGWKLALFVVIVLAAAATFLPSN